MPFKIKGLISYLKEAKSELKKVNWLSRPQLIRQTLVVIGVTLAVAFFLGAIDFILNILLERLII